MTVNAGWTVGDGAEARLCGNWTGKVEYLYVALRSMTTNLNKTVDASNVPISNLTAAFNSRTVDQIVRAGINYKFN